MQSDEILFYSNRNQMQVRMQETDSAMFQWEDHPLKLKIEIL